MRLEFGNPDHINMAQSGEACQCGHAKMHHLDWQARCLTEDKKGIEKQCECQECGTRHLTPKMCECENFTLKA